MFSFLFGGAGQKKAQETPATSLQLELQQLEQRWYDFLQKLAVKYEELTTAFTTEAPAMYAADEDQFKRAFHRFKSGVDGQLSNIQRKAYDTAESQIHATYYAYNMDALHPAYSVLNDWRNRCLEAYRLWEDRINQQREAAFEAVTELEDPETQYRAIMEEHERIKDSFTCKQCGGRLKLDRVYFIATYIACPQCQTQNTFIPGAQARMLEHIARPLAEKRMAHLYRSYRDHIYKGRFDDPAAVKAGKAIEVSFYREYLRAVFDEIHRIVPDLREQNEQFYERLLKDYMLQHS